MSFFLVGDDLDFRAKISILIGYILFFGTFVIVHAVSAVDRKARVENISKSSDLRNDTESGKWKPDLEMKRINHDTDDGETQLSSKRPRYCFIDCTRGLAISFVTFFHYVWNLQHNELYPWVARIEEESALYIQVGEFWIFFGVSFLVLSELFNISVFVGYAGFALVTAVCIVWHHWASQVSGVGMIMFCVGISSFVQNEHGIRWPKVISRIKKLFLVSLGISVVTYILFPNEFIYFGAIHCITLLSILHIPFLKFPQFAILGTVFIFSYKAFLGEFPLEVQVFRATVDHMPWFENLGYLLFGIFCGYMRVHQATHYVRCLWGSFTPGIHLENTIFPFLGRHSLFIFIAHQVVLFPVVTLFSGNLFK
jgi:uncharacterized membrane protein